MSCPLGVGHTAWAPEGHEGQSQKGQKGLKLEVGARRAPRLLVLLYVLIDESSPKIQFATFLHLGTEYEDQRSQVEVRQNPRAWSPDQVRCWQLLIPKKLNYKSRYKKQIQIQILFPKKFRPGQSSATSLTPQSTSSSPGASRRRTPSAGPVEYAEHIFEGKYMCDVEAQSARSSC